MEMFEVIPSARSRAPVRKDDDSVRTFLNPPGRLCPGAPCSYITRLSGGNDMLIKMKRIWDELNRPIYTGERLHENLRALTIVSLFTALLGAVLIALDLVMGQTSMLIPSVATFLGGIGCAYVAGVLKKRDTAVMIPTIFCAVAFTFYAATGAADGTAILWTFLLPIGISYFVSVKYSILLSVYYTLFFCILFYSPLRHTMAAYYTPSFMVRFPLLYTSMAAFTAIAMIQYHRSILLEQDYTKRLHAEVEKQTKVATERAGRLEIMSTEVVNMLAVAIDAKDRYTNGHSIRVAFYSVSLARHLGLPEEEIKALRREAMLHDIGKIGVPDAVLNKPGRLTDGEFEIIKSHTTIGGSILDRSSSLDEASYVALYHHERFDGKGYPSGRKGLDIPLHARIVTIADSYDAMRSDRIYRKGLPGERIHAELVQGRGSQFDPELLDAFLELEADGELDRVTEEANRLVAQAAEVGLPTAGGPVLPAVPAV